MLSSVNYFRKKISIIDVSLGSKYASNEYAAILFLSLSGAIFIERSYKAIRLQIPYVLLKFHFVKVPRYVKKVHP